MRNFILLLLLCSTFSVFSQQDTRSSEKSPRQALVSNDSDASRMQWIKDSAALTIQIRSREEGNIKAMLQVAEQVRESRAKEKRNAYLRIGIGVAFLIVLIVGLLRKRAKK